MSTAEARRLDREDERIKPQVSICRKCGQPWVWYRYLWSTMKTFTYTTCAQCAANAWHKATMERQEREDELRRAIEEMAASGRLRH